METYFRPVHVQEFLHDTLLIIGGHSVVAQVFKELPW
jgi:hypothetical protein